MVGEALGTVNEVRVVCNGELDANDVAVAKRARGDSDPIARALVTQWQAGDDGLESLLARDRYRLLHELLASGRLKVKVIGADSGAAFLHGKAGVIEQGDGKVTAFIGSANDSYSGWSRSYEMIWEDDDPESAKWVQSEFEYFWNIGVDLPDAVIQHIGAISRRTEYASIADARGDPELIAGAALADRPLSRAGQLLRPWQKRFVQTCVDDFKAHGRARYLIADDVGLGKTLSMAAAALILSLLHDGPVLILAPATLIWQWQVELKDMLGIPAAVWSTTGKQWLDPERRGLTPKGEVHYVAKCPWKFGIMSTGLITNGDDDGERGVIAKMAFGVVVLDEAHKARGDRNRADGSRLGGNNLMTFMERLSANAGSVLLGTATPIQLRVSELWDLLNILQQGASHVLGRGATEWRRDSSIDYLSGERAWPQAPEAAWALMKDPLGARYEHDVFRDVRRDARLSDKDIVGPRFDNLTLDIRREFARSFATLSAQHNPIIRRVVRRTRHMLEANGMLKRIAVAIHPSPEDSLNSDVLEGDAIVMSMAFSEAYRAAELFCRTYSRTRPAAGFLKTILLRRIGSSPAAGLATALNLLEDDETEANDGELGDDDATPVAQTKLTSDERDLLQMVVGNLRKVTEVRDPKVDIIIHYLDKMKWLEKFGSIIFSQYLTTALHVADELSAAFPTEPIALYAGGSASFVMVGGVRRGAPREAIKGAVQRGEIRLVVATDAACEGLNLQKLGSQINIDLPWNPSKLEQRKGRVQRIGQSRDTIHVANLRYSGTVEDEVYAALSARFGDIFSVIGQLPDSFEDEWVAAVLRDRDAVKHFPQRTESLRPAMDLRYSKDSFRDEGLDWEYAEKVISDRQLDDFLRSGW